MITKKNSCAGFIILIYLLVFQTLIQKFIPAFQYFDEVLALFGIIYFILKTIKTKKIRYNKKNVSIFLAFLIIIIIGFYSNIKNHYQTLQYIFSDFLVMFKFFLVFYLSRNIINYKILIENKNKIIFAIDFIVYILAILTILNYIFNIFPSSYMRFGIKSNQLFFGHPTGLTIYSTLFIAILLMCGKKLTSIDIIISICLIMTTLRFKAFGAIILCIGIILYTDLTGKRISFSKLGIIGMLCIAVAYSTIIFYFENDSSARGMLLNTSIKIANDYFPLGTGFGTYASYFSVQNYSEVYKIYKLNNVYGLMEENAIFVSDTFWPMILGQFGYLGLISYIFIIYKIYGDVQKNYSKQNKGVYQAKMICLGYLIISSIAESAFVNPISIAMAIILGLNINDKKEIND